MPDKSIASLSQASPIPIEIQEDDGKSFGPYRKSSKIIPILKSVQKYSSYTFTIFSFLHGVNVLVVPSISTGIAEEILSMNRSIYQATGLENILVWGSLSVHILSGALMRIIRNWRYRERYGGSRAHDNKLKRKRRDSHLDHEVISQNYEGEVNINDDSEVGLMGGLTNYFGFGFKKSLIFRYFGLSPLQATGYLSIPLVLYHSLQVRIIPNIVEGDSSYINFDFISYLFNNNKHYSGPILNWIIYPALISFTTYHIISGWMKLLNVRSLTKRKIGATIVNIISLLGIYSLYTITKIDCHSSVAQFIQKRFDMYIDYFYLS
ncbi:putative membrane protein [Wickerhamomyces ciferrii]|uniref:Membrane protein n=1 Tax=Wickerhamomyces ciferrii (strain ATCC 14091 / BCRC 22168 / CBS 111 / JCM 3599 / NBRC 0793 / NRRL Y-1031 F-60-10) TaxID=1206466 RepID=K0KE12_WICCF|nr:uncharacterized protein BN7_15 [Wickerhamomyces ciferrii]CCH40482.1 putative membrane protein [Wickerhamomyces ciferrii]